MKAGILVFLLCPLLLMAQKHTPLPHGMVFGQQFEMINPHKAADLEAYMGNQTRSSVIIIGRVLQVTKPHEGWFELDAGNGRVITAHFKNYGISLPPDLKGKEVIINGVAAKQFSADGRAHTAADNSRHKPIDFEVTGLYVNR